VGGLAKEPSVAGLDAPPHPATPSHNMTNDECHMLRFDTENSWSSVRGNEKANSVQRSTQLYT
jgi:hypothetical protein